MPESANGWRCGVCDSGDRNGEVKMKNRTRRTFFCVVVIIMAALTAPETARSQGTITYVSSLGQPSVRSATMGSDSWQAALFGTGNNPGGYVLNSIEVAMTPADGIPNDLTVMLYSAVGITTYSPGNLLETLVGSGDPAAGGTFTYDSSGLTLAPSTAYYLVLTSATSVEDGAFEWSLETAPPSSSGGWNSANFTTVSNSGSSWNITLGAPQLAIMASAVPEPGTLFLLGVPGGVVSCMASPANEARSAVC
jgi:hypothetical protein